MAIRFACSDEQPDNFVGELTEPDHDLDVDAFEEDIEEDA